MHVDLLQYINVRKFDAADIEEPLYTNVFEKKNMTIHDVTENYRFFFRFETRKMWYVYCLFCGFNIKTELFSTILEQNQSKSSRKKMSSFYGYWINGLIQLMCK